MDKNPHSFWRKSWPTPRWLRVWLLLAAVTLPFSVVIYLSVNFPGWTGGLGLLWVGIFNVVIATVVFGLWRLVRWVCAHLRRTAFIMVCGATVIALFYAEEDWRGRHAWNQFQSEWEARGEHFDLASLIPPPVPDDQNFALAPVVASCYGQILDRNGHELWPRNTNLVNRLIMDYEAYGTSLVDAPSIKADWTRGIRMDFTGLQQYYRALAAKTNLFPVPSRPQSPAADVLLALSRFDPAIEDLRQAAQLPYSRFPLEYDKDDPARILLPHLAALKSTACLLQLRALAELQTGRTDQALADVKLMLRLADSVQTEPYLISHLVRLAIVRLALQPVWEGLAAHQWSDPQLTALDAGFAKLDLIADYKANLAGELETRIKFIQYLRQHPGEYSRLIGDFDYSDHSKMHRAEIVFLAVPWVPAGWFYQNQLACGRCIEEFYLPAADVSSRTFNPAQVRQGDAFAKAAASDPSLYDVIAVQIMPALGNAARNFAHTQSSVDLARIAIALERCRLVEGKYPASLESLAPKFMDTVPHDVIGGQPLHYRLADDGQFVLYSVGWNETDDGGTVALIQGADSAQDIAQGDWVWRYPAR